MAKPTFQLVQALRDTADSIEQGTSRYSWRYTSRCNCGLLAQRLASVTEFQLNQMLAFMEPKYGPHTTWSYLARRNISFWRGRSDSPIFCDMVKAGLTRADLRQLERLSNPKIIDRMEYCYVDEDLPFYICSENVASYMRAWAKMLEEQLPPRPLSPEMLEKIANFARAYERID
jgi:hypothetical protein